MRWLWVGAAVALLLAAGCTPPARPASDARPATADSATAPPALRHLTVANTSLGSATAFFVAQDVGIFARHGLDVDVPLLTGVKSVQALVARQVEYGLISSRTVVDARLAGSDVIMIAGITPTLTFSLFSRPEITDVAQLRGQPIGVTQIGASADFSLRYSLRRQGLEAERDYAVFQTGGMPESLAAIESGGLLAAVLSPPTTMQARKNGLRELIDITALGIDYVSGALATNEAFLADEPETTQRFLKGLLEGIYYAKTNPAATKQILAKHYQTNDPDVLDETYSLYVERLLSRVPAVSRAGIVTVLEEVSTTGSGQIAELARVAAPEQFVDRRPLEQLETSGFVEALWARAGS
jgi:NitT/TauT family transport system substrate-binding protein